MNIEERVAALEVQHTALDQRVAKVEKTCDTQTEILITLTKHSAAIEEVLKQVKRIDATEGDILKRLGDIEKEPADKWKKAVWEVTKAVILAVAGIAIAKVFGI